MRPTVISLLEPRNDVGPEDLAPAGTAPGHHWPQPSAMKCDVMVELFLHFTVSCSAEFLSSIHLPPKKLDSISHLGVQNKDICHLLLNHMSKDSTV